MNEYIVHLYREMRLSYTGIEADTPQSAAEIASGKPTDAADNIEDCDGDNLTALVDLAGDEDYRQSVTVEFETERLRKAAPKLLAVLESLAEQTDEDCPAEHRSRHLIDALEQARTVIAEAKATGIPSPPSPAAPPARFEIEHDPLENPNRAYVLVDGKFDVAIVRTGEGIVIDVYPKDWIDPIDTMTVWDEQVAELEHDAAAEA